MFYLSKPSISEIESFVENAQDSKLSYKDVGATKNETPPTGYTVDHNRVRIGRDDTDWEMAKQAIRDWKMFDLGWVELHEAATPIEKGQNVAVLIKHFGFYSVNAARIVYLIDESDRFGFAYGTLTDHGESGEERFMVERDAETDDVFFDLYAFSRPNCCSAKLGYPLTRMLQKQFAADSKAAVLRAITTIG
jgi:uncharacterized protein (UPF0548 family)